MSGTCDHQEETKEWQGLATNRQGANIQLAITDGSLTGYQGNPGGTAAGAPDRQDTRPAGTYGGASTHEGAGARNGADAYDRAGRPYRTTRSVLCGAKEN